MQMRDPPTVGSLCQDQTSPADRATGAALQSEGRDRCSRQHLNDNLLGLQVYEWRRGLSGGRPERHKNRTPRCVGLHTPGGSAHSILLRKEYGCVIAKPGAEAWPIQVVEVLDESREELSYRERCGAQIRSSLNVPRPQFALQSGHGTDFASIRASSASTDGRESTPLNRSFRTPLPRARPVSDISCALAVAN